MKEQEDPVITPGAEKGSNQHIAEASGGITGAIGGAGLGALAGPIGAAAGAVIGAVAGTLTGWAVDAHNASEAKKDEALDEEIGVVGGDIGVASLEHPDAPARPGAPAGAYSAATVGGSDMAADNTVSAEGPFGAPP